MSRAQRRGRGSDRTVERAAAGDLLAALADEDCRALLQAADGEALSASELSDACELPLSTTYRKVERLTEAGLFEEQLRLCSSGKHTSEYTLAVQAVELSLSDEGIDIELSTGESEEPRAGPSVLAGAD